MNESLGGAAQDLRVTSVFGNYKTPLLSSRHPSSGTMADPEPPTKKLRADTASPEPSQESPSPSAATSPVPSDCENDNIIENVDELLEDFKSTLIEKYKSPSGLLSAVCLMRKLPICYHCCVRHLCIRSWKIYSLTEEVGIS